MTASEIVEALRALGVRDVVVCGTGVASLGTVLADAQRMRLDAQHVSVVLDQVAIRPGHTWRPSCCLCVDSLEVALGCEVEAYRVNRDTGHDTGCCSFCDAGGRDVLVAAIPDTAFALPPAAFLHSRCGYRDRGGALARLLGNDE